MCCPYLCFPKSLGTGKFSDFTSCFWYPCPLHPLLQLLLEVRIQGVRVPQRALGSTDVTWPHLPPFSPSSAVLGFLSEARAVAMGCIEMSWHEVKAVLLCPCMHANCLHACKLPTPICFNSVLQLAGGKDGQKFFLLLFLCPARLENAEKAPKAASVRFLL